MEKKYELAIITVSDRCYLGTVNDLSGSFLRTHFKNSRFKVMYSVVIPDDFNKIKEICLFLADTLVCDVVILSGGTGLSERDVTPEALKEVIKKEIPGIQIALIANSLKYTEFAPLSRLISGIRNKTLFVSLPGNPKACSECMEIISPILEHALNTIQCKLDKVEKDHIEIKKKFLISLSVFKKPELEKKYNDLISEMFEIDYALTIIFDTLEATEKIKKSIYIGDEDCVGYYIVYNIHSRINLPSFRASLKDGYAISTSEKSNIKKTMKIQIFPSTDSNELEILKPEYCYKISTGAWVPNSADAVVKIEDADIIEKIDEDEYVIKINKSVEKNENVKDVGSDVLINDLLLSEHSFLNPGNLGLLASVGIDKVDVYEKPIIAILSTGDELLNIDEDWTLPYIYDSNRTILKSLLIQNNYCVNDLGIAKDEIQNLYFKIITAFEDCDILITSGSISVGEKDYLKLILLNNFNAIIHFSRVNIKPGMPFTYASCIYKNKPKFIFALPGNTVSVFVIAKLFVLPALKVYCGCKYNRDSQLDKYSLFDIHTTIKVKLNNKNDFQHFSSDNRPEFVRCKIDFKNTINGIPVVYLINKQQQSSKLLSLQNSNALVVIERKKFQSNYLFDAILID